MADSTSKSKRRLRPASPTVREQAQTAGQAAQKKSVKARPAKQPRAIGKPFRAVGRTLKWLGRHIVPRYFRNAFTTLREVTWPNRKETRQLTVAVVLFAIIFAALITAVDYGLDKVFKRILLK